MGLPDGMFYELVFILAILTLYTFTFIYSNINIYVAVAFYFFISIYSIAKYLYYEQQESDKKCTKQKEISTM